MKTVPDKPWTLEAGGTAESGHELYFRVEITPVQALKVEREEHDQVPVFQEQKWRSGVRFKQLEAWECSLSYALLPDSVVIEDADGVRFQNGLDYYFDAVWGAWGRTPDSRIGGEDTVYVSYEYQPYRLDSVVVDKSGQCYRKQGIINGSTPLPPELDEGETLIGNILFDRNRQRLSDDMLFPFIENCSAAQQDSGLIEKTLEKTLSKLRAGEPIKILAWGDSVTACNFIKDESQRWINIFVEGLRKRFPQSEITLVNLGWPGKAINTFQCEPSGSQYNYEEQVLESGADLVTLEFVNDAYLTMTAEFDRIYNRVAADFKRKKMEPIIILPHPVRPDWMGLDSQKNIEEDPRPYVQYLRKWAVENNFAIADVSARFLSLWKEGIPYNSLMLNNINHPDARGIWLYADTLLKLFPEQ